MCEEEGARTGVVKLPAVVTLDGLDTSTELGGHIGEKLDNVEKVSDFSRTEMTTGNVSNHQEQISNICNQRH